MAKRIVIKVGEYQDKEGKNKGEYLKAGVILNNDNGEYILLDPSVNLAGALIKQNVMAAKQGKEARDMLMVSIFTDDNQQQAPQQQRQSNAVNEQAPTDDDFNDSIPF